MKAIAKHRGEFTGRHMVLSMLGFFGVIIGVNVTMAIFAGSSWTGVVVQNSYIASQEFNTKLEEARAQANLGWTSKLSIGGGKIGFVLNDKEGKPVAVKSGEMTLRRPAYDAEDQSVRLTTRADGKLGAQLSLRDGVWIAEIRADAGLDLPYRETHRFVIRNGDEQ